MSDDEREAAERLAAELDSIEMDVDGKYAMDWQHDEEASNRERATRKIDAILAYGRKREIAGLEEAARLIASPFSDAMKLTGRESHSVAFRHAERRILALRPDACGFCGEVLDHATDCHDPRRVRGGSGGPGYRDGIDDADRREGKEGK